MPCLVATRGCRARTSPDLRIDCAQLSACSGNRLASPQWHQLLPGVAVPLHSRARGEMCAWRRERRSRRLQTPCGWIAILKQLDPSGTSSVDPARLHPRRSAADHWGHIMLHGMMHHACKCMLAPRGQHGASMRRHRMPPHRATAPQAPLHIQDSRPRNRQVQRSMGRRSLLQQTCVASPRECMRQCMSHRSQQCHGLRAAATVPCKAVCKRQMRLSRPQPTSMGAASIMHRHARMLQPRQCICSLHSTSGLPVRLWGPQSLRVGPQRQVVHKAATTCMGCNGSKGL